MLTMSWQMLVVLILIAGLCGTVAKALTRSRQGSLLTSVALGFIGALFGPWLARQFHFSEPLMLRLRITAARPLPAPRLSLELRDSSGLLVTGSGRSTSDLGWDEATSELAARFEVEQLPLADGRFHLRLGLTDESGERLYHWLDEALTFVVYPAGDERGVVRMEGRWSGEEIGAQAERIPT